ncbi:ABC transporter substrate-binding protein [Corynebacterium halotolerans]|uniref:Putative substrate-binding protein n=1 Tax=Corynebacterium halotolerans YIM 70093 = DSM 44683 TaxID=1121362 RepID=M1NVN5_9CORY|nr:ABC transporter substrate-binding protein [Corynebacterium halotolerans]AGF73527.1 putative substrate-binding protein [Corynebacterium halotolerans YIM 70093 = DSM 44683]
MRIRPRHATVTVAAGVLFGLTLTACSSEDPLAGDDAGTTAAGGDDTIVIGTANFPESEIIGQVWAAALEDAGFDVEVNSGIGSREVYLRALEEGSVDLVPEYLGNLTQFLLTDAGGQEIGTGADAEEVYETLQQALPEGLAAGEYAEGESKDSYRVTRELAEEHQLETLGDLNNLEQVRIAGNPELAERPYGPQGLTEVYGVGADKITLVPISDGGGPLTIAALTEGTAEVGNIYTTSPLLDADGNEVDLVTLEDPEQLILPQNVLPLMQADAVPPEARDVINGVNDSLTTDALVEMNLRNIGEEKAEPTVIARDFVDEQQ